MKRHPILLLVGLTVALGACDYDQNDAADEELQTPAEETPVVDQAEPMEETSEASDLVADATSAVREMKADPELADLLRRSRGVFIVPDYGRGAAVVGAQGGEGVLLAHRNGEWSAPAFYDYGGISVGAEFGGTGGQIAMILMTDQSVNSFEGENTFSLNADAGFTLIDYSARGEGTLGEGDVILWSDTEGAFAGVSLGASDVNWDDEENAAYYGRSVTANEILNGQVSAPQDQMLEEALPR